MVTVLIIAVLIKPHHGVRQGSSRVRHGRPTAPTALEGRVCARHVERVVDEVDWRSSAAIVPVEAHLQHHHRAVRRALQRALQTVMKASPTGFQRGVKAIVVVGGAPSGRASGCAE